ncbi:hypothetical protein IFM89_002565 [Coptis chinensis]|uniref:ABC-2 type transporter transmembrane domain-containing protein n=1 Tax=Coptis chinensis TaxID=261450 RepID=A0A835HKP3_9MAGN|nr:hypothetical protein IFM89_002565 [Coptis chinensis]
MDEPTSGLDARATAIVMRTVRNIVDTGKTVVCTIHQPIIDIFEAFDELFLMKRGEEIYVGPLGHNSCHLIKYFEVSPNPNLIMRNKLLIKELSVPPPSSKDLYFSTQYSQPILTQCMACLWKQHLSYWRDPAYTAVQIFFTIVVALMFGSIFWKQGSQTFRKQVQCNGFHLYNSSIIGTQNASTVQPVVVV